MVRDTTGIESALNSFISAYNGYISSAADLTKYDSTTDTRGALQGNGTVLRVSDRLSGLVTKSVQTDDPSVQSLQNLGIRFDNGGKLTLNTDILHQALLDDPTAVTDFFLKKTTGFSAVATSVLDGLTNTTTGTFTLDQNSLDTNITGLKARVDEINATLEVHRQRLLNQFIHAETVIGKLQQQQQALTSLSPISAPASSSSGSSTSSSNSSSSG